MMKQRWKSWLVLTAVVLAAAGCRSLPRSFEPPEPSFAFDPATEGPLADFDAAWAERSDGESGFLLLDRNDEDLWWRLAVIDSAKISLDLQTYLWARDFSGRLFASRMQAAADRGVRIRLLVDDFLTRGSDRAGAGKGGVAGEQGDIPADRGDGPRGVLGRFPRLERGPLCQPRVRGGLGTLMPESV